MGRAKASQNRRGESRDSWGNKRHKTTQFSFAQKTLKI
jgi:hypothetical protein